MQPDKREKKRKRAAILIKDQAFIRKGFDAYFKALPGLEIVCMDAEVVTTRVFAVFLKESDCLRLAYEAPSDEKPKLDVSKLFSVDEVLHTIKVIVDEIHCLMTRKTTLMHVTPRDTFLLFDPSLCTGVLQFLDYLGLEAVKKKVVDNINFHTGREGTELRSHRIDFIVCYINRSLMEDDLYWKLIRHIGLHLESYSELFLQNEELFRSHRVFEQICMSLGNES